MKQTQLFTSIAVLALSCALQANGRGMKGIKYTADTFQFNGQSTVVQRYDAKLLSRLTRGSDPIEGTLALHIGKLQLLLDSMKTYVLANKEIKFIENAEQELSTLKTTSNDFDPANYANELNFYTRINKVHADNRYAAERKQRQETEDSIRRRNEEVSKLLVNNEEVEKSGPGAMIIASPKDLGISESAFKTAFGSVTAYNFQVNCKLTSSHGFLVPFIGAKAFWADVIPAYMASNLRCSGKIAADNGLFATFFVVNPGITWGDMDTSSIFISFTTDKDLHITKGTIRGNANLVERLFIRYWEKSETVWNGRDVRKGVVLQKDYLSDRITFDWKGAKPVIIITKNPAHDVPVPLQMEGKQ